MSSGELLSPLQPCGIVQEQCNKGNMVQGHKNKIKPFIAQRDQTKSQSSNLQYNKLFLIILQGKFYFRGNGILFSDF